MRKRDPVQEEAKIGCSQSNGRKIHWRTLIYLQRMSDEGGQRRSEQEDRCRHDEPGWRGFALPRLQPQHDLLVGILILGILWGFWHLPLFLVPP